MIGTAVPIKILSTRQGGGGGGVIPGWYLMVGGGGAWEDPWDQGGALDKGGA